MYILTLFNLIHTFWNLLRFGDHPNIIYHTIFNLLIAANFGNSDQTIRNVEILNQKGHMLMFKINFQ